VRNNTALPNLNGFNLPLSGSVLIESNPSFNLQTQCWINGNLVGEGITVTFRKNNGLTSINCLHDLGDGVPNSVIIEDNPSLVTVDILRKFPENGQLPTLRISRCPQLRHLHATGITSLGSVTLEDLPLANNVTVFLNVTTLNSLSLVNISGSQEFMSIFPSLTEVFGRMTLSGVASLRNISFHADFSRVNELFVVNLPQLESLTMPPPPASYMMFTMSVSRCPLLTAAGIDFGGYSSGSFGDLILENLTSLSSFDMIRRPNQLEYLRLSQLSLASRIDAWSLDMIDTLVVDRVSVPSGTIPVGIASSIFVDSVKIEQCSGMTTVGALFSPALSIANISISRNPHLVSISHFDNMETVTNLTIASNPSLVTIGGFDTLTSFGQIVVSDNAALVSMTGFTNSSMTSGGKFFFVGNNNFATGPFNSFPDLITMQWLVVENNALLECLGCSATSPNAGLRALRSPNVLSIHNNARLTRVPGAIVFVANNITLASCPSMVSAEGLEEVSTIQGALIVSDMSGLRNFSMPLLTTIGREVLFLNNARLASVNFPLLASVGLDSYNDYLASNMFWLPLCRVGLSASSCTSSHSSCFIRGLVIPFSSQWMERLTPQIFVPPLGWCHRAGETMLLWNPSLGVNVTSTSGRINMPMLETMHTFWVQNNGVRRFSGMSALRTVVDELAFVNNRGLVTLQEFANITSIGKMRLVNNTGLCPTVDAQLRAATTGVYIDSGSASNSSAVCLANNLPTAPPASRQDAQNALGAMTAVANSSSWTSDARSVDGSYLEQSLLTTTGEVLTWMRTANLSSSDVNETSASTWVFFDSLFTPSGSELLKESHLGDEFAKLFEEFALLIGKKLGCGESITADKSNLFVLSGQSTPGSLPGEYTGDSATMKVPAGFSEYFANETCVPFSFSELTESAFKVVDESTMTGKEVDSSVVVINFGTGEVSGLSEEQSIQITITKRTPSTSSSVHTCVWWDDDADQWNTEGCTLSTALSTDTHAVCLCTHLTSFALLLSSSVSTSASAVSADALEVLTYIGCIASMIACFLFVLTFVVLRRLCTGPTKLVMNLCVAIFFVNLVFLAGVDRTSNVDQCRATGAFLYFFLTASFVWMLCISHQLYTLLVRVELGLHDDLRPYYAIGWLVPLLLTAVIVIADGATDRELQLGNDSKCVWMVMMMMNMTW
jgi:hypothetical protein